MSNNIKSLEIYRRILATASKLERIQSNQESVIDFFLTPTVKLYTQLCNDCLKLLFECEFKLDHFRKVEELIWKRIYHDVYRFHKTKRQINKKNDDYLVESHFISGIGFYSSLIVKLRIHFKIHLSNEVIFPLNFPIGPSKGLSDSDGTLSLSKNATDEDDDSEIAGPLEAVDDPAKEWAHQAIYRSLIYMGDLARYLLEKNQFDFHKLAFQFYKSASRNQPHQGLPYNQMATSAGSRNHYLDAVCNYMRCALKPIPFEGAEGNMRKIFEANSRVYDNNRRNGWVSKLAQVVSDSDPLTASESMLQGLIVIFIKLTSDIWSAITDNVDDSVYTMIANETQLFFECLCEATELKSISGPRDCEKPRYLCPTIMFEFRSISIMLLAKNRKSKHPTDHRITNCLDSLIETLALNLLHYSTKSSPPW